MATESKTNSSNQSSSNASAAGTTGAAPSNPFAHNPFMGAFNGFDPAGAWGVAQQTWQKMISDSFSRAQAWADECASIEKQMYDRANEAIDTWAKVAHDTIAYGQQLTAQARKLGFEAARKASAFGA